MCKHFLESGECPLQQYCQFAHGPEELRQPNDPLPKHFGKTALGAVHSNYKTEPCKNWQTTGECKFGDGCSFYHTEEERRKLIDPLPNLPEGVTLPPMPDRIKHHKQKNYHQNSGQKGDHYYDQANIVPYVQPMIQISSIADIMALGGFNPNKYLGPSPVAFTPNGQFGYQQAIPPHMMGYQSMQQGYNGMPAPVNSFIPGQGPQVSNFNSMNGQPQGKNGKSSPTKNGQRYEKKDKQSTYPQGGNKKKSNSSEQKKYVSKEKKSAKEESPKKAE